MAQAANIYAHFLPNSWAGSVNLTGDTLKMALLGSGYTPNLVTDNHFSDIRSNEITGTGYTQNGVSLTGTSVTLTAANSWGVTWTAGTGYLYGQVVKPSTPNGFLYRCVSAGTTAGSSPTFPTVVGQTVTDNTVVWACMGDAIVVFTSNPAEWFSATFSASYAVLYDAQSGTYTTEPLIVLETFASTQTPSSQNFLVPPDPVLGWFYFSPPS